MFNHTQSEAAMVPAETNTAEHDYSLFIPKDGISLLTLILYFNWVPWKP